MTTSTCKHYNALIHGGDMVGRCACPDCGKYIYVYEAINNWLIRMREATERAEKALAQEDKDD